MPAALSRKKKCIKQHLNHSFSQKTIVQIVCVAAAETMPRPSIPEDRINLRLILVSGKTKDYLFRPSDSAGEIAQYVFDNWPIGEFKANS